MSAAMPATLAEPVESAQIADGGDLRSLLGELSTAAGALAALAAAFNARTRGAPLAPSLAAPVRGVLDALGMSETVDRLPVDELRGLLAEIRVFGGSHRRLAAREPPLPGWQPPDADFIQAAGDVSAGLPRVLARRVAPRLEGLSARLELLGARFLDVGAGAAALSVEMARTWPRLTIVGLEPWAPALELGRLNVRAAGLGDRIELRGECGEQLADEASYDLAWIPSLFIAEPALRAVVERVWRALRDGGWLLLPVLRADAGSLAGSVVRLRSALWGGSAPTLSEAAALLSSAGFVDLQSFASAPTSATGLLAARRAPASRG